ncbi:transmembrane protein 41B-like isoform X2 [Pocillopora damicornis]|uniref:transmembrane protein 41B-like isoform X2 n=1 Tax=Pocillopora damicornis TaxID=46731 RepID=UPI000F552667|nr:transmembrane protein 41B-like isoform X2 [Pocillopora damicornis]
MTMTDKNFPSELIKLKGRQPLPQNHQNHINNMTDTSPRSFKKETSQKSENNTGPFIVLGLIFLTSLVALAFVYWSFPKLRPEDKARIKLPRDMEDAKGLGRALSNYTDEYFTQVLLGFVCSSVGASFCYLLFYLVGRRLVKHYMPERVDQWCEQVNHHRDNLLSYIIFLRITPFLPNWFINISSPVIGVPLLPFFVGTFVGVAPPSFGFISAGVELYVLTTTGDVMSFKSITIVVVSALLSLAPVIFKRQLRAKIE